MVKPVESATKAEIARAIEGLNLPQFSGVNLEHLYHADLVSLAQNNGITEIDAQAPPPTGGGPTPTPTPTTGGGGARGMDPAIEARLAAMEAQAANAASAADLQALRQDYQTFRAELPQEIQTAFEAQFTTLRDQIMQAVQPALQATQGGAQATPQPAPAIGPGAANIATIVGKTLDEAAEILPAGYVINNVTRENHKGVPFDHIIRYTIDTHNISVVVSDGPAPGETPEIHMARRPTRPLPRAHAEPVNEGQGNQGSGKKRWYERGFGEVLRDPFHRKPDSEGGH